MMNLWIQGCLFFSVLFISGIHTNPKPLDTVNVNLNIDQNEPLGLKNAQNGGGVDVGGGQVEGAKEQAVADQTLCIALPLVMCSQALAQQQCPIKCATTGDPSCAFTDKQPNCAELKDPHCTSGGWVSWMMTNCPKTCNCATTPPTPPIRPPPTLPPTTEKLWRDDGRCGPEHLLPNGRPGQCDPKGNGAVQPYGPCCSEHGWCGDSSGHCSCPTCINYAGTNVPSKPNPPSTESCPKESGYCVYNTFGFLPSDQNVGVKKLDSVDGNTMEQEAKCLAKCRAYPGATGCEVVWNRSNRGCYAHTQRIDKGNGVGNHACWVFSKCTGTNPSAPAFSTGLVPRFPGLLGNLGNHLGNLFG